MVDLKNMVIDYFLKQVGGENYLTESSVIYRVWVG
jgi:hypothetical protein